ncbi:diguanylate cyclase/phosphodiesterase (GGDEF & EAL domains) with PAS/PAC sensor(s) [hydrothermal vent metagenome]|uniref:Diguanylate cyclase/phosphodiesterase (GGDEF & EAL domains) with PAS/PAC sensor(S) n=1 Tax=hydrothermal vent metagenome TaxID=652676 RepID=A0A3B1BYK1_9ZZZZ
MIKKFLLYFIPVAFILAIILGYIHFLDAKSDRALIEAKEAVNIVLQKRTITGNFKNVVSDLMYLAVNLNVHKFLIDSDEKLLSELAENYLSFATNKGLYDQVRYIDESGMEIIRINYNNGDPRIVPTSKLQNKIGRYYFKNTSALDKGEVFVSPLDLNMEGGRIENPLKPVIRFATPIAMGGEKRGILILNYLAAILLNDIKSISNNMLGEVSFLNSGGYWLIGPDPQKEWGFMYADRLGMTFRNEFPEASKQIFRKEEGILENSSGLFTFTTIYPIKEVEKSLVTVLANATGEEVVGPDAKDYYWKIVSRVPPEKLYKRSNTVKWRLARLYLALVCLVGVGAWFLAIANVRRKEAEERFLIQFRKMEKALDRAEEVQQFLSKKPGLTPFFVISSVYRTSKTIGGGDTVRWLTFKSRYGAVYVHDVSGHDIEELLLNILSTAIVDDYKICQGSKTVCLPSDVLAGMNDRLVKFCQKTGHYVTAVYMLLDFESRDILFSLAGHPMPWLISSSEPPRQVGGRGMIMGMFDIGPEEIENSYTNFTLRLKQGEVLLVYTDGLMDEEGASGIKFKEVFEKEVLPGLSGKTPQEAYEILKEALKNHLGDIEPDDDISFVFLGARPEDQYEVFDPKIAGSCKLIADKLKSSHWGDESIKNIDKALGETIAQLNNDGDYAVNGTRFEIGYILDGDVLELSISPEVSKTPLGDLADEIYFSESGASAWMLFGKDSNR